MADQQLQTPKADQETASLARMCQNQEKTNELLAQLLQNQVLLQESVQKLVTMAVTSQEYQAFISEKLQCMEKRKWGDSNN